jgi:hypothetical protein
VGFDGNILAELAGKAGANCGGAASGKGEESIVETPTPAEAGAAVGGEGEAGDEYEIDIAGADFGAGEGIGFAKVSAWDGQQLVIGRNLVEAQMIRLATGVAEADVRLARSGVFEEAGNIRFGGKRVEYGDGAGR